VHVIDFAGLMGSLFLSLKSFMKLITELYVGQYMEGVGRRQEKLPWRGIDVDTLCHDALPHFLCLG
jgi:hypothetical protein